MEKGYNIDDILSEVKKRREEAEAQIKSDSDEKEIVGSLVNDEPTVEPTTEPIEEPVEEPVESADNTVDEDEFVDASTIEEYTEEPEQADEPTPEQADEPAPEEDTANEEELVDAQALVEQEEPAEEPLVISMDSDSERADRKEKRKEKKKKKKKKKNTAIRVICILLIIILSACLVVFLYVNNALNQVTDDDNPQSTTESEMAMDRLIENFQPIEETDAAQISSLQDMIKQWYRNGTPASSSRVLNILLVGEDTRGKDVLESGTRADSAIIASLNADTKQIKLTSILRDAYAYWETTPGDESTGKFDKINAAMSTGDIHTYINAVENLYKIKIDNYVIVNFTSFEKIIDTLGGVELELTRAEINEINNHPKRYGKVYIEKTFDGNKGTLKLTGKQALAYCRIRKIDSDNMRANRQKICLSKVFSDMKDASSVQLLKILNDMVPYVRTDMSKNNIVKTAKYALKEGWINFDIKSSNVPEYRNDESGAGGIFYGAWCWKADYPMDAYMLQMDIYGKSSITLARTRVDYINCRERGFYSELGYPTTETILNEHYGEVTTRPAEETTIE
ncbi:LCP family protein [uncultured Eubacterium sp.]|uniref:LCP family glycopolymer transferase n=1 Tax=uncultured Eubacterium sp. TaxID=165185 RepID=UPI0025D32281|nr:LCP family protein [uncultured Eubacterium sp.]